MTNNETQSDPGSLMERQLRFYKQSGVEASVFLSNGIRLNGKILDYDHSAVLISSNLGPEGVTAARSIVATLMRRTETSEGAGPNGMKGDARSRR